MVPAVENTPYAAAPLRPLAQSELPAAAATPAETPTTTTAKRFPTTSGDPLNHAPLSMLRSVQHGAAREGQDK
ncbi:hypothetical protein GCM10009657_09170 [Oryzihumus leptocrescens]